MICLFIHPYFLSQITPRADSADRQRITQYVQRWNPGCATYAPCTHTSTSVLMLPGCDNSLSCAFSVTSATDFLSKNMQLFGANCTSQKLPTLMSLDFTYKFTHCSSSYEILALIEVWNVSGYWRLWYDLLRLRCASLNIRTTGFFVRSIYTVSLCVCARRTRR